MTRHLFGGTRIGAATYYDGAQLRRRRVLRRVSRVLAVLAITLALFAAGWTAGGGAHVHQTYPPDCREDEIFTWQWHAGADYPSADWRCIPLDDVLAFRPL